MEVFGELFDKLDQAIYYNDDLQSIAGNNYSKKFLPSIYFFVQKYDQSVPVSCGLSQATMQLLCFVPMEVIFWSLLMFFKLVMVL